MFDSTRPASRAWRVGFVVAAAAALAAASSMSPAAAQVPPDVPIPAEIISRHPETNGPMAGGGASPSISAQGHVVAFQAGFDAGSRNQPMYRHRPPGLTGLVDPPVGENPTISDDGCVIAYSQDNFYDLDMLVFNRCDGVPTRLGTAYTSGGGGSIPAPGVSADGSVIAFAEPAYDYGDPWTVGVWRNGIRDYSVVAPDDEPLISDVAISDDGSVVAFSSYREVYDPDGDFVESSNVRVFDSGNRSPTVVSLEGNQSGGVSLHASVSGDGSLIAFESSGSTYVFDRSTSTEHPVYLGGRAPDISRDGRHLTFETSGETDVVALTSNDRWRSTSPSELVSYTLPGASGAHNARVPAVSSHGRWVAWETDTVGMFVDDPGFASPFGAALAQVVIRERRPVLAVDPLDFGPVSGPVTLGATVRNVGPSGWRVTSIAVSGGAFSVAGEDCPAVLHPGTSCTVRVRYTPTGEGQQTGQVIVRDDSYPGIPLQASGRLVGISDPDEPPPVTEPEPDPLVSITITPNPVVFDEVVVGLQAPGRTATVENIGELAITIDTSAISGPAAGDFTVVSDGCAGTTLQIGSTCDLELEFAATDAGTRSASLSVSGSTGASASATLEGAGRFDAELSVLPEVTSGGQSVFVSGTGYPASTLVQVTVAGTTADATTDGEGKFTLGLFVLTGVPQGELPIDDVADAGRFDAEPIELIVVGSPVRPQATSVFSRIGRRHVSR